ncbi:double-stranded DNA-dependent ATPase, partial [Ascoidea rubescens DSM 1968]
LRDYQQECLDRCFKALTQENKRRIGVSLPTGSGKTVIFSHLIKKFIDHVKSQNQNSSFKTKTLILVHRKELAYQAAKTMSQILPEYRIGIDMGDLKVDPINYDIVIASIQSLVFYSNPRLPNYDPDYFKLIIIDEVHHAASTTYQTILSHFGSHDFKSGISVAGFSATIRRHDGKSLSRILDHLVFHKSLPGMIEDGWLTDLKFTTVVTDKFSLNLDEHQLSKLLNTPEMNSLVLKIFLQLNKTYNFKSVLLFGADVSHVQNLTKLFNENNIPSAFVTGTTNNKVRFQTIEDFKQRKINILMNCNVFTEGTDIPQIDAIFLVKPTNSPNLMVQMIGRGLRLHGDKSICHVINFI